MRFINVFIVGYMILLIGIGLALWQSGVLNSIPPMWIFIGVLIALGIGVMASVSSGKPTITEEIRRK
jgi:hypothetical protein